MPDSLRARVAADESLRIVSAIPISSQSPEETLRSLDLLNIEWQLSDEGHLMIKSWLIVATEFVPRTQIARLRQGRPAPAEMGALNWVSSHLNELQSRYGGQWVAVARETVVTSASTLPQLLERLRRSGVSNPFITQIPAGSIVWHTAYAG